MTRYIGKRQRQSYDLAYHEDPGCVRLEGSAIVEATEREIERARACSICAGGFRAEDVESLGENA